MNSEPTDATLLKHFSATADDAAFTQVCERYASLVYHAAFRQLGGNAHSAADASQAVFSLLAAKAHHLTVHRNLAGWLHVTTRLVVQHMRRREQRRVQREHQAFLLDEITRMDPTKNQDACFLPLIDEVVAELGGLDRDVVLLRYEMDLTFAQIGSRVGLSENAARMRAERALEKLRFAFAKRGIGSTAVAIGAFIAQQAQAEIPVGFAKAVATAALTTPAQGAIAGTSFFFFMSTSKMITTVSLCLCATGIGLALFEASAAAKVRDELREAQRAAANQAKDLEAELQRARSETASAVKDASSLQVALNEIKRRPEPTTTPASKKNGDDDFDKFVASRPDLQQLYIQQQTVRFLTRYGPLYQKLHLTPEQVRSFVAVMSESAQAFIDVPVSAVAQGLTKTDPSVKVLLDQAKQQRDRGLRELLGVEGFAEFEQYDRAANYRMFTNSLAGNLFWTEAPLTPEQADRFSQVLAETAASGPSGLNLAASIEQAKDFLKPIQLAILQSMKDQIDVGERVQKVLSEREATSATAKLAPLKSPPSGTGTR